MKNFLVFSVTIICLFILIKNTMTANAKCIINANGTCITKIEKAKSVGNNYWKGAAKQCGGEKNLPTEQDLLNIKSYIYEKEGDAIALSGDITTEDIQKALNNRPKVNEEHIKEFGGFNKYSNSGLYVFSSKELRNDVYFMSFSEFGSNWAVVDPKNTKLTSNFVAMCIKH
ncbi:hypothetical protein IJ541_01505 [bacterium]|nr:hypothetical protein [bacterium]